MCTYVNLCTTRVVYSIAQQSALMVGMCAQAAITVVDIMLSILSVAAVTLPLQVQAVNYVLFEFMNQYMDRERTTERGIYEVPPALSRMNYILQGWLPEASCCLCVICKQWYVPLYTMTDIATDDVAD